MTLYHTINKQFNRPQLQLVVKSYQVIHSHHPIPADEMSSESAVLKCLTVTQELTYRKINNSRQIYKKRSDVLILTCTTGCIYPVCQKSYMLIRLSDICEYTQSCTCKCIDYGTLSQQNPRILQYHFPICTGQVKIQLILIIVILYIHFFYVSQKM